MVGHPFDQLSDDDEDSDGLASGGITTMQWKRLILPVMLMLVMIRTGW